MALVSVVLPVADAQAGKCYHIWKSLRTYDRGEHILRCADGDDVLSDSGRGELLAGHVGGAGGLAEVACSEDRGEVGEEIEVVIYVLVAGGVPSDGRRAAEGADEHSAAIVVARELQVSDDISRAREGASGADANVGEGNLDLRGKAVVLPE